jgi:hypothetical protein
MSTMRTHFTFRVDTWTPDGESVVEHVAGIEDYQVALVTYRAACQRWPGIPITLRQGARVIEVPLTAKASSSMSPVSRTTRLQRSVSYFILIKIISARRRAHPTQHGKRR